jgi:uncharacterized protein involved in type VI secretion and phage assembly
MPNQDLAGALGALFDGTTRGVRYDFATSAKDQPGWRVRKVHVLERLSSPYRLHLELWAKSLKGSPMAMLGKSASLTWQQGGKQALHGIVEKVKEGPRPKQDEGTLVHVTVVPALKALHYTSASRIFSNTSLPDVVKEVLERRLEAFGRKVRFKLIKPAYPQR